MTEAAPPKPTEKMTIAYWHSKLAAFVLDHSVGSKNSRRTRYLVYLAYILSPELISAACLQFAGSEPRCE